MTPFDVDDLKQSRFLTQGDVDPPVLVTIRSDDKVNVAKEGVEPQYEHALTFDEFEEPLTVNITNGELIAAIMGSRKSKDWIGRKIVLYREPTVRYKGKVTGGIRVRAPKNQPVSVNEDRDPEPDWVGDDPVPPPEDEIPF